MTHDLKKETIEKIRLLPTDVLPEVLDFIDYLQHKYNRAHGTSTNAMDTFGSWRDEREPDEIVDEIYRTRTVSNRDLSL